MCGSAGLSPTGWRIYHQPYGIGQTLVALLVGQIQVVLSLFGFVAYMLICRIYMLICRIYVDLSDMLLPFSNKESVNWMFLWIYYRSVGNYCLDC